MTLRILFFSLLRDVTRSEELLLESPPATVGDLLDHLYERYPGLSAWDSRLLIAVDLAFAGRARQRQDAVIRTERQDRIIMHSSDGSTGSEKEQTMARNTQQPQFVDNFAKIKVVGVGGGGQAHLLREARRADAGGD